MINPACEVNEKGKNKKNRGNAVLEDGTKLPLDLDANDIVVVDQKNITHAEEDREDPEQRKVTENTEPDPGYISQCSDDKVIEKDSRKKIILIETSLWLADRPEEDRGGPSRSREKKPSRELNYVDGQKLEHQIKQIWRRTVT